MLTWLTGMENAQLWGIPFFKSGDFFTQTVFAVMSSIACSSRVLDFFVVKHNEEVEKLRGEIKEELEEDPLFDEQNKQYTETQDEIEELLKQVDECVNDTVKTSRKWAIFLLVSAFILLATGAAQYVGFWPLLAFIPIALLRGNLLKKVNPLHAKLEAKGEYFKGLRRAYNTMKNKLAAKADAKVKKAIESVPKKTGRKSKASTCSPPSS